MRIVQFKSSMYCNLWLSLLIDFIQSDDKSLLLRSINLFINNMRAKAALWKYKNCVNVRRALKDWVCSLCKKNYSNLSHDINTKLSLA